MIEKLEDRLNKIPARITSKDVLKGSGIGNEVAFYIFDYPPEAEERLREYVPFLLGHLAKTHPGLRIAHINLFEFMVRKLASRGFLEQSYEMQMKDGDASLIRKLKGQFEGPKLASYFVEELNPKEVDLVFLTGVGNAFPVVRAHTLLSALQPKMEKTPLVMFYPGVYDGQYVRLFGKVISDLKNPYYRAFKLVP
jgi:hypothetical protein